MHPDFPPSNETADILTKEVIKLRQEGHPVNMNTMDLAWRNCVANETIKPIEAAEETEETNPSPAVVVLACSMPKPRASRPTWPAGR